MFAMLQLQTAITATMQATGIKISTQKQLKEFVARHVAPKTLDSFDKVFGPSSIEGANALLIGLGGGASPSPTATGPTKSGSRSYAISTKKGPLGLPLNEARSEDSTATTELSALVGLAAIASNLLMALGVYLNTNGRHAEAAMLYAGFAGMSFIGLGLDVVDYYDNSPRGIRKVHSIGSQALLAHALLLFVGIGSIINSVAR